MSVPASWAFRRNPAGVDDYRVHFHFPEVPAVEQLSNLRSWECRCDNCGCDVHPLDLTTICREQFNDAETADAVELMFTTRCPLRDETMFVWTRGSDPEVLARLADA